MDSFRGPCTVCRKTSKKPNSRNFCCYFLFKFQAWDFWHCAFLLCFCCISWITPNLTILGACVWVTWKFTLQEASFKYASKNSKLHAQMTDLYNNDDRLPYWATQHKTIIVQNLCIPFWRSKGEARQWRLFKANTNKTTTNLNSFWLLFLSTTFSSYFLLLSCFCR